ncbi:PRD domain-containing protein [Senegalia massiliensis]|jgi:transcriptional antiterminator|uniref:PRD domain-containing protein n=1 Tax=Senegalia massiliensis TaxID=1720316 RepID=UPI0010301A0E|nr:PRD domain-containing protein [Senegalia massiliensis]
MDDLLKQRLELLEQASEIDSDIKNTVIEFADKFEKKYSLEMTEDNSSMLITHLAMALSRIKKGEIVEAMDSLALDEIKQCKIYNDLPEFYNDIEERLNIILPQSEKDFIALHACTLVLK